MSTREPGLRSDSLSLSTYFLKLVFRNNGTDNEIATGTGFIYEYQDHLYLVTNGHNVTGINPETNQRISNHAGVPNLIVSKARIKVKDRDFLTAGEFVVDIYRDRESMDKPTWFIHKDLGYKVDVVAIPVCAKNEVPRHVLINPINSYKFDFNPPEVGDDVFVLGYPFNLSGGKGLPIWKRGSIATEPFLDLDDLPKVLIDTATRSGMSGSPVIFQRTGLVDDYTDENIKGDVSIGTIRGFLGVYSARIGAKDELQAQLGVVWKRTVIDEIIREKVIGTI